MNLPQHYLFHTNTTVEVFRLIKARWADLPAGVRTTMEERIAKGPAPSTFREDIDAAELEHILDRSRYDILGEMHRDGLELGEQSKSLLATFQAKYPVWVLRPSEQAGFHVWAGDASWIGGNSQKLDDVPDDLLIDEAKGIADEDGFGRRDPWQGFCQSYPMRALRALEFKARAGERPQWAWDSFLWAGQKLDDPASVNVAADLLLEFPDREFQTVAATASWWLEQKANALDDGRLWRLWDKIEAATVLEEGASSR